MSKKKRELEQLTAQLVELRQRSTKQAPSMHKREGEVDEMQLRFLKQAVFQLLTDFHAEEHLRAILSILKFTPQERKEVYAKFQEKKGRTK